MRRRKVRDGFICIAADDKAIILFDAKEGEFINATECLRAEFNFDKWERRQVTYKNFSGLVAATDGITFELDEKILGDFIKDFCANYSALELGEILADLKSWLPTLFGVDESKNKFRLLKEIARGGQGAVFQTQYPNIVLKLELNDNRPLPANDDARKKFLAVRTLPLPRSVNVTLPMNILEKVSGYTMRMMDDTISFKAAFAGAIGEEPLENSWLENFAEDNPELTMIFFRLIKRGGLRRFFRAYLYAAQMLSEIHGAGLVY